MTEQDVVALMESATSKQDWADKCDQVKERCNGYPEFWHAAIIASGIGSRVYASFGSTFGIRFISLELTQ